MSRLTEAFKALTGKNHLNIDGEKSFMKILSNIGFGNDSIENLLEEGYLNNNHVYSIINRIASSGADIPVIIKNKLRDGTEEIITEGDFYNFVHNPNSENNYQSFTYQSLVYQLTTGNEIQYGVRGVGSQAFSERWNLAPQFITPKVTNLITGPKATSYKYSYSDTVYTLDTEEVMHLRKFNPDPSSENAVMGLSPLSAAYRTLVASNEVITADASLIKNKGAIGLLTSKGQRPNTPEEGKAIDKALKTKIGGGENYGSVKVTSGNFDFIKFAMSPADLQILESGVVKLRDLCSVYGVNSRMFNDPKGASFNNAKQDTKDFYVNGVLPPLNNDISHFNKFYVPGWNDRDNANYVLEADTSSIEALQEDKKLEAEKDKIIMDGVSVVLNMPISPEGKQRLLIDNYGFEEADAIIITNIPNNEE
jgi:HK97 family phage portal protein